MPVLPLIDLLILLGWTCLALGGVLKAISITTTYQPEIFYLGPFDLLVTAGIFLLFALTLAARTWVKAFPGSGQISKTIELFDILYVFGGRENAACFTYAPTGVVAELFSAVSRHPQERPERFR